MTRTHPRASRQAPVWHFVTLVILVAFVEGVHRYAGGGRPLEILAALPQALYRWVPTLVGVAVSIRPISQEMLRTARWLSVSGMVLMVGLDVGGGLVTPTISRVGAVVPGGQYVSTEERPATGHASWVAVLSAYGQGEMLEAVERLDSYPPGHPRTSLTNAVVEAGMLLLVPAITGLLLLAGWWVHRHVVFDQAVSERVAHLVVAWMLGPLATTVVVALVEDLRFNAMFGDGRIPTVIVPFVLALGVGLVAWSWVRRSLNQDRVPPSS